jgi:photosystem II stability/assembly factor-like uncharacterized protein
MTASLPEFRMPSTFARPAARLGALALVAALPATTTAQRPVRVNPVAPILQMPVAPQHGTIDTAAFTTLRYREIGPFRGGRSVAVAGSASRPLEYWMGTTGGGVFKTTDGGMNWAPMTDKYFGGTIGAIGVYDGNPDIVYVGTGEYPIRGNVSPGEGVWKTTDGGRTWSFLGLRETQHISRVRVHPTNPDIVWVGAQGKAFANSQERGVYKSTDGGKSWKRTLFVGDSAGVTDLVLDPTNPNVLYAAIWQVYRKPWKLWSGGAASGLWKSTDGGETWTEITRNRGLPRGIWGNTGVTVSPANPRRLWALIEAEEGGVYRSDDAGESWVKVNEQRMLRQRAWYYSRIFADPKDTNVVYALNTGLYRSTNGGKAFTAIRVPHGDNHDLWIAPNDPQRMANANDGGANVSFTGGRAWTDQDFATAQFYHVSTTNHFPYWVCGAQQDNSTLCGPSRKPGGITIADWQDAGGGESGYVTTLPDKPNVVFAGSYGGLLTRKDFATGFSKNVSPWPDNPMGYSSEDIKHRFQWTFPIVVSPHDPKVLYVGGSELWRSTNEGQSWTQISGSLARADKMTMGPSGGPITKDQTGVETYATIFAMAESPVKAGVLWTGSDDGWIHVSQDNGKTWTNVTPKALPEFARISIIEPSRYAAGTAYVAANRFQLDDWAPYLFRTTDFGKTWTRIDAGIERTQFTRVIREDPVRRGLLFAGTEKGVWVSFNDGESWQPLQRNLPPVPVHDLAIKEGDLVVGTHGRSFWILDDISILRQVSPEVMAKGAHLFAPRDPYRESLGGGFGGGGGGQSPVGQNPPAGLQLRYWLKGANQTVTLEIQDAKGNVVRRFTSAQDSASAADSVRADARRLARRDSLVKAGVSAEEAARRTPYVAPGAPRPADDDDDETPFRAPRPPRVANKAGMNTFVWNFRYPEPTSFDGMILWAAGVQGPLAPPGKYVAKLSVGGEVLTRTFELKKDPRLNATQAELEEQFRVAMAVRDRFSDANDAVRGVRGVRTQMADRAPKLRGADSSLFDGIRQRFSTRMGGVEGEVYQVKNQSSQDPLNFPIKLNNKIGALAGVVGSADGKPTAQSYQVFEILSDSLENAITTLRVIVDDELPKVNEILKRNGLAPVTANLPEKKKVKFTP